MDPKWEALIQGIRKKSASKATADDCDEILLYSGVNHDRVKAVSHGLFVILIPQWPCSRGAAEEEDNSDQWEGRPHRVALLTNGTTFTIPAEPSRDSSSRQGSSRKRSQTTECKSHPRSASGKQMTPQCKSGRRGPTKSRTKEVTEWHNRQLAPRNPACNSPAPPGPRQCPCKKGAGGKKSANRVPHPPNHEERVHI